MKILTGKYKGFEFYYTVGYHITDFAGKNYSHDEVFKGLNLEVQRKLAFEYFNNRKNYSSEPQTFFDQQLTIHGPAGFKHGKHVAYSLQIWFNYISGDEISENLLVDNDFDYLGDSDIIECRELERDVFKELGLIYPKF